MLDVADNFREAYKPPAGTQISRLLIIIVVAHMVIAPYIPYFTVPDNILLVLLYDIVFLAYFALTITAPYWFHVDRKRVMQDTDYTPSRVYYLSFLAMSFNVLPILLYLNYRGKAYRRSNTSGELAESTEEEEE